MQLISVT